VKTVHVSTPRTVEALLDYKVVGVAAGGRHSLFLTEGGSCFAAGKSHAGQCGLAADESEDKQGDARVWRQMRLPGGCKPLVQVAAGHAHSLLLDCNGRAYACGLNTRGQCGFNAASRAEECVHVPTLVVDLLPHRVRAVEAGPHLSLFEVEEVAAEVTCQNLLPQKARGTPSADGISHVAYQTPGDREQTTAMVSGAAGDSAGSGLDIERNSVASGQRPMASDDEPASLWLAGNVEGFNIPGTVRQVGGLRFLPSCYQWQYLCSDGTVELV